MMHWATGVQRSSEYIKKTIHKKLNSYLRVDVNLMTLQTIICAELDGIHSSVEDVQSLHRQIKGQPPWPVDLVNGQNSTTRAVQLCCLHARLTSAVTPEHTTNSVRTDTHQACYLYYNVANGVAAAILYSFCCLFGLFSVVSITDETGTIKGNLWRFFVPN